MDFKLKDIYKDYFKIGVACERINGRVTNHEIGNPAMYIINSRHEIILNRRIDMKAIPQFLEEYEKIGEEKKRDH